MLRRLVQRVTIAQLCQLTHSKLVALLVIFVHLVRVQQLQILALLVPFHLVVALMSLNSHVEHAHQDLVWEQVPHCLHLSLALRATSAQLPQLIINRVLVLQDIIVLRVKHQVLPTLVLQVTTAHSVRALQHNTLALLVLHHILARVHVLLSPLHYGQRQEHRVVQWVIQHYVQLLLHHISRAVVAPFLT